MLEKRLVQIIKVLVYLILFAPAVVTYSTSYPFLHGKVFWIEVLVEILLGAYLILIMRNRAYLPGRTKLFWAVTVFMIALVFSTIFSVDRPISFWGDWSRMTGLIFYLHLYIFFIVFSATIRNVSDIKKYLIFFSVLGSILSLFAWMQRYGINFLRGVWVGGRVGSTLDNPAFFAIFLLSVVFICFWISYISKGWLRAFFLSLGIFNTFTIFITQTRGVMVGVIIAFFVVLCAKMLRSSLRWKVLTLIILNIVAGASFIPATWSTVERLPGAERLFGTTLGEATAQTRLLTWDIAFNAFLRRPIFGWGHEAFYAAFNTLYNPEFVNFSFSETWFDKTHNIFLDLLSMNGAVGFTTYLLIFFFALRTVQKGKENGCMPPFILFIAWITSYFISNFFEFETPASLLALFFIFALIQSCEKCVALQGAHTNAQEKKQEQKMVAAHSPTAMVATGLIIVGFLWFIPGKSIAGSRAVDRAGTVAEKDAAKGIELYRELIQRRLRYSEEASLEYANQLGRIFVMDENISSTYAPDFNLALQSLDNAMRRHPYDVNFTLAYAALANTIGTADSNFLQQARNALHRAGNINPNRQQVLLLLGETELLLNNEDAAIAAISRAQNLAPRSKEISYRLAIAYFAAGREREGFAQLEKARLLGMDAFGAQPLLVLISVHASNGNWQKVIELYAKAIVLEPRNAKLYAQMATAYATIGDKAKAQEAVYKAMELDPKLKVDAVNFLRLLETNRN